MPWVWKLSIRFPPSIKQGISTLVEEILERIPESAEVSAGEEIRVAIIGRPNVGKSSLLNRLLGSRESHCY